MAVDRDARLAAIYQRGANLRTTRRRKLVGCLTGIAGMGVFAVMLGLSFNGGTTGGTDVAAGSPPTAPLSPDPSADAPLDTVTSSTTASLSTSATTTPTAPTSSPPTGVVPPSTSPTTTAPTIKPTTTALVCRNSKNPSCGPFRYDPTPTNQPTVLQATPSATTVPAGTPVEMHVLATDPDSAIGAYNCNSLSSDGVTWSDPAAGPYSSCEGLCLAPEARYGPWDLPPPTPGRYEVTSTHTYTQPGTYDVQVEVTTKQCDFGPYPDSASTKVRIVVTAAP